MRKSAICFLILSMLLLAGCSSGGGNAVSLQTTYVYKMAGTPKPLFGKRKNYVAFIKRGERFKVLKTHKDMTDWVKVRLSDGETSGWIHKKNIFIGKREIITFTKGGKRYSRPDESSPSRKLKKGQTAIVLKKLKNGWVKVNFTYKGTKYHYKGTDGWVREESFEAGMIEVKPETVKEAVSTGVGRGEVSASSFLKETGGYSYSPKNAFDGVMSTTWQEGVAGAGIGQWIEIKFSDAQSVSIKMVNGFNHTDAKYGDLYSLNARVKRVRVSYGADLGQSVTADLLDGDKDFQQIAYGLMSTRFRITILDVYPGSKWQDTAISEIKFEPAGGRGAPGGPQ